MINVFEAPLKWTLLEKLSLLYDQIIAPIKTTAKQMANTIFPVVNIF